MTNDKLKKIGREGKSAIGVLQKRCPTCTAILDSVEKGVPPIIPNPHFYCSNCNRSWEIWDRGTGKAWINPLKRYKKK